MTHHVPIRRRGATAAVIVAAVACVVTACSSSSSSGGKHSSLDPAANASSGSSGGASLSALLPKNISDAGVIRVLSDIPSPPFEMYKSASSKTVTGMEYDLAQSLGRELGVKFEFIRTPFSAIIPALQANKGDVIMSAMTDNAPREKVVDFVDYFEDGSGILVKKGNPDGVSTFNDLCGKAVATEAGAQQLVLLHDLSKSCTSSGKKALRISALPTISDAELAISSGNAQAVVQDQATLAYAARVIDGGNAYSVVNIPGNAAGYQSQPAGMAVLRSNRQLSSAIQKALAKLISNGEYLKVLTAYGLQSVAVHEAKIGHAN